MAAVPQNKDLDVGGLLQQSWNIFMKDPVNWLLVSVVGTLAFGVGGFGGFQHAALKAIRGEKIEVGDAFFIFQRTQWILPLIGLILAVGLVGTLTCGLGFLAAGYLLLWMVPALVMFDMNVMDAAKLSKELAMKNAGASIMILVVAFVIGMVGGFVPFGFVVTTPLLIIFQMLAIQSVYGQAPTPQQLDYAPNAPGFAPPQAPPVGVPAGAPPAAAPPAAAPPAAAPPAAAPPAAAPPAAAPPAAAPPAAAPPAAAPPAAAPPAAAPPAAAPPAAAPPAAAPPAAAEPAKVTSATTGPAAAPSAGPVETSTQSTTNNPDEIVTGRTIAMSSVDFEQMLRDQQDKKDGDK